jgi:hypothetical protein
VNFQIKIESIIDENLIKSYIKKSTVEINKLRILSGLLRLRHFELEDKTYCLKLHCESMDILYSSGFKY